ncbi:hypothetical protein D3C85_1011010 [compost metagenome]
MNYKNVLISLIFIVFLNCKNNKDKTVKSKGNVEHIDSAVAKKDQNKYDLKSILGKWTWQSEDKSQQFTIDFIKFSNDSVYAKYCAVYNNGSKLDCDFDETIINIRGIVENEKKLKVKFNSFFHAKNGSAEIIITDSKELKWKVVDAPNGEFYAPSECILKPKALLKATDSKSVNLPLDFENLKNCSQNCNQIYPKYTSNELPNVAKIALEITQYEPEIIYLINNGNLNFQTYIVQYSGDAISQTLINIKNDKLLSSQDIGYELGAEDESYQSFVINEKLDIDILDINYKTKVKKVVGSLKINSEGKLLKQNNLN